MKTPKQVDVSTLSQNWRKLQEELTSARPDPLSEEALQRKRETRKLAKQKRKQLKALASNTDIVNAKQSTSITSDAESTLKTRTNNQGPLAIDCEFVGIGMEGKDNMLARVSIVSDDNTCVYDTHVSADSPVTDWRTAVSGIRPADIVGAPNFYEVQNTVRELISGRMLIGHGVHHDLQVLGIVHPKSLIRDTSKFSLFRKMLNRKKTPSLKLLAKEILGVQVQLEEHDSIEDARVAMSLYQMHKKQWKTVEYEKRKVKKKLAVSGGTKKSKRSRKR